MISYPFSTSWTVPGGYPHKQDFRSSFLLTFFKRIIVLHKVFLTSIAYKMPFIFILCRIMHFFRPCFLVYHPRFSHLVSSLSSSHRLHGLSGYLFIMSSLPVISERFHSVLLPDVQCPHTFSSHSWLHFSGIHAPDAST